MNMEETIQRLVIDEDDDANDDLDDPAIINVSRRLPTATRGPGRLQQQQQSQRSRSHQAQMLSGAVPLTTTPAGLEDIWSVPKDPGGLPVLPTPTPPPPGLVDRVSGSLPFMQRTPGRPLIVPPGPVHTNVPKNNNPILPQQPGSPHHAEEMLHSMLLTGNSRPQASSPKATSTGGRTLQDIEWEYLTAGRQQQATLPAPTNLQHQMLLKQQQQAQRQQQMRQMVQQQNTMLIQWAQSRLQAGEKPEMIHAQVAQAQQRMMAVLSIPPPSSASSTATSLRPMGPPPSLPPLGDPAAFMHLHHQQQQIRRMQEMRQHQQQHWMRPPINAGSPQHQQYHNHPHQQQHYQHSRQYQGFPEWATPENSDDEEEKVDVSEGGWMTDSEKDWVVKVQTKPLVVDSPYVQDYYYTIRRIHSLLSERQAALEAGKPVGPHPLLSLVAPVTADQVAVMSGGSPSTAEGYPESLPLDPTTGNVSVRPYRSIQFENSLGKLALSSVHNPRQIIDVTSSSASGTASPVHGRQEDDKNSPTHTGLSERRLKEHQVYRSLLATIEKMYGRLLQIDEFEMSLFKIQVPTSQNRTILESHRSQLVRSLVTDTLAVAPSFAALFSVRKGCRFFATLTLHLEQIYLETCLTNFFASFADILKNSDFLNEVSEEMFPHISQSVSRLDLKCCSRLLDSIWKLDKSQSLVILANKLPLSMVLRLIERFASVCQQENVATFREHCDQLTKLLLETPEPPAESDKTTPLVLRDFSDLSALILKQLSSSGTPVSPEIRIRLTKTLTGAGQKKEDKTSSL